MRAARLDPADHIGDLQAFFIILVLHQRHVFSVQLAGAGWWLEFAFEEVREILCNLLMIAAFNLRTLPADLAHVVEEQGLHLIVLGFFGAFEQRVVDLGKDPRQVFSQAVHH